MDWTEFSTYGSIASIVGILISALALSAANKAKTAARNIQVKFLFNKRIPQHLRKIDELLENYNTLLKNIHQNNNEIRTLHSLMKAELESLKEKSIRKDTHKLASNLIETINKKSHRSFFKETKSQRAHLKIMDYLKGLYLTPHNTLWKVYDDLSEIHAHLNNLISDRKYSIKW